MTSNAGRNLAKKRWKGKTKKQRLAHIKMMNLARKNKKEQHPQGTSSFLS